MYTVLSDPTNESVVQILERACKIAQTKPHERVAPLPASVFFQSFENLGSQNFFWGEIVMARNLSKLPPALKSRVLATRKMFQINKKVVQHFHYGIRIFCKKKILEAGMSPAIVEELLQKKPKKILHLKRYFQECDNCDLVSELFRKYYFCCYYRWLDQKGYEEIRIFYISKKNENFILKTNIDKERLSY